MKINKFVGLVKKKGTCYWINTDNGVYLGTRESLYSANTLPYVEDREQVTAILDLDKKSQDKVAVMIEHRPKTTLAHGIEMCNEALPDDVRAERMFLAATVDGVSYTALLDDDGELIFFSESLLAPIADILKEDQGYISYYIRKNENGQPYIIVKDGFITLAAIMPVKILNEGYIAELQKFLKRCMEQFEKEKIRDAALAEMDEAQRRLQDPDEV